MHEGLSSSASFVYYCGCLGFLLLCFFFVFFLFLVAVSCLKMDDLSVGIPMLGIKSCQTRKNYALLGVQFGVRVRKERIIFWRLYFQLKLCACVACSIMITLSGLDFEIHIE